MTEDDYHISAGFGTFHEICPYKEKAEKWDDWNSKTNSAILFDKYEKMVKRLMESGYVLSKFGKDKTYSQTEMMYIFQGIIEGEK